MNGGFIAPGRGVAGQTQYRIADGGRVSGANRILVRLGGGKTRP